MIISGIINVKKELIYDIIKYNRINNVYYIETLSKYIYINKKFDEQPNIILKKKYDYLIKIIEDNNESKNYELKIYKDNIEDSNYINMDVNNNNKIIMDNINNKYKFKIGNVIGLILLEDEIILNYKYDDMIYKKMIINEKMIYKNLDYINKKEIKLINNKINYITNEYNNNILLINGIYNRISIILNSENLKIGDNYDILLLKDLYSLLIEFDDNNEENIEINILNGIIDVYDIEEKKNNILINNDIISQKLIIKNSSLKKYGYINLKFINKIENKYIFLLKSLLLNNNVDIKNIFI